MTILNSPVQVLQQPHRTTFSRLYRHIFSPRCHSIAKRWNLSPKPVASPSPTPWRCQPLPERISGPFFAFDSSRQLHAPFQRFIRVWGGDRSDVVLLLWEAWHSLLKAHFQHRATPDEISGWELPASQLDHDLYPDVVLRALSVLVPGLQQYWNGAAGAQLPRPKVDGGYYTRTPENMPLIGTLRARGTWCSV
jgi:hypothetical protein